MYLSKIRIEGYRVFNKAVTVPLKRGLNLLVGENGCGKSTVIDTIRLLLNEDEYSRNGINDEDFYSSIDKKNQSEKISIKGKFTDLSEEKKVEYLTWLDNDFNAVLNIDIINESLEKALGSVFGQSTKIQFNDLTYERIVESLRLVFFPAVSVNEDAVYRNLFENSLGYNNLIYLATILAEFEGLKDNYSSPRILLIEELEAHLHPQIQIKVLKYLEEQACKNDIQVIIISNSNKKYN